MKDMLRERVADDAFRNAGLPGSQPRGEREQAKPALASASLGPSGHYNTGRAPYRIHGTQAPLDTDNHGYYIDTLRYHSDTLIDPWR